MQKPLPMDDQKTSIIWLDWERGAPLADIARAIEKPSATVFHICNIMAVFNLAAGKGTVTRWV
ncbi:MAG: hypothetical protein HRU33_17945 [Rhodobacteraceae bacterium]|nr:hypothetical protein [Paracoccaceae bacterium]